MKQRSILLVEDNADDEEFTLRALKRANVSNPVVVTRDGRQALDYLLGSGEHAGRDILDTPAVVLLDLKLPKLSGIDVLQRMRAEDHTRFVPVVVLTSSSEDEDMLRSYMSGANSYVRKPVAFSDFARAVAHLGIYWTMFNQLTPRS